MERKNTNLAHTMPETSAVSSTEGNSQSGTLSDATNVAPQPMQVLPSGIVSGPQTLLDATNAASATAVKNASVGLYVAAHGKAQRASKELIVGAIMVVAVVVLVYSGGMLHEVLSEAENDTKVNWPLFGINALLNLVIVVAVGVVGNAWHRQVKKWKKVLTVLFLAAVFSYVNLGVLAAVMTPNDGFLARGGIIVGFSGFLIAISSVFVIACAVFFWWRVKTAPKRREAAHTAAEAAHTAAWIAERDARAAENTRKYNQRQANINATKSGKITKLAKATQNTVRTGRT